ncbi:MAG TPA: glycosyltransferase family 2 protein [Candidatus Paceibacterota bacterium]|nr:glycosyltransferase family 2 protein [Candidatus Paceibacterota bacterium]
MKASIIIPALNEEKYIEKTLVAVSAQIYSDFEVIVIDNESTDKTVAIARKNGARVIIEKRKGTMWACEAGRNIASGDVIVRLDADCLPEKDWLSKGMKYFENTNVVGATGPYDYYDGSRFFRSFSLLTQKYIYKPVSIFLRLFKRGIFIEGNSFMRASALETIGGFDTSIVFYGDGTNLARRLACLGTIVFDNSLSMKTSARRFKAQGTFKISILYIFHFFRAAFVAPITKPTQSKNP